MPTKGDAAIVSPMKLKHSLDFKDPSYIKGFRKLLAPWYKYFYRVEVHGQKNLSKGKFLYVGNHNGVLGHEVFLMLEVWFKYIKPFTPKVLGLAHDIIFKENIMRTMMEKLGAIPASPENTKEAFDKGY